MPATSAICPPPIETQRGIDKTSETASRAGWRMTRESLSEGLDESGDDPRQPGGQNPFDTEGGPTEALGMTGKDEKQAETDGCRNGRQ